MAEKNPATRPPRTERLSFKVTPAEKEMIKNVAKHRGWAIGEFCRDSALFQAKVGTGTIFYQAMPSRKVNVTEKIKSLVKVPYQYKHYKLVRTGDIQLALIHRREDKYTQLH